MTFMTIIVVMVVTPTVEQARAFCAAASTRSYADAAVALQIRDRVSLIHLVDRFTKSMGRGQLILATPRGVTRLTTAGAELVDAARLYVLAADALMSTNTAFRFSAFPAIAVRLVQAAPILFDGQPRLVLDHVTDATRSDRGLGLIERLVAGGLDLVVAPAGLRRTGLEERYLYAWRLRVVLPKRDPLRDNEVITPNDLRDYALVAAPQGHVSRSLAEAAFTAEHVPFRVEVESTDQALLRSLADGGRHFAALLPDDAFGKTPSRLGPALATAEGLRFGGGYSLYSRESSRPSATQDDRALILAGLVERISAVLTGT